MTITLKHKLRKKNKNKNKSKKQTGGYWCMFNNEQNTGDVKRCDVNGFGPSYHEQVRNFFYFYQQKRYNSQAVLYSYKPHIFKHSDDFNTNQPKKTIGYYDNNRFHITIHRTRKAMKLYQINIASFINITENVIHKHITYERLIASKIVGSKQPHWVQLIIAKTPTVQYSFIDDINILWQKVQIPPFIPDMIRGEGSEYQYIKLWPKTLPMCIQIIHLSKSLDHTIPKPSVH